MVLRDVIEGSRRIEKHQATWHCWRSNRQPPMVSAWNGQRTNMLLAVPIYNWSRSTVICFIKIIVWLRETRYTIVCVNTIPQFRVFLGAPSRRVSRIPIHSYQWQTIESKLRGIQPPPVIFPPATLEAASRRISLIYQDFIFKNQKWWRTGEQWRRWLKGSESW